MSSLKLKHSGGNGVIIAAPSSNPAADRTITCPDLTANAVMATVNGITEFDMWMLTSAKTSDGDITANLQRNDQEGVASQIGTGMSESSGIFTFPTTGKWLVMCSAEFNINGDDNCIVNTKVTTDNSSYGVHSRAADGNNGTGGRIGKSTSYAFIDVTDTSQVKVKFEVVSLGTSSYLDGNSAAVRTGFIFMRLGDT